MIVFGKNYRVPVYGESLMLHVPVVAEAVTVMVTADLMLTPA